MTDLIERIKGGVGYSHNFATAKPNIMRTEKEHILGLCALLEEAAAALEAAREDAAAVNRVLAVVEEFEGCTGAGYRYMAANIRSAIDQARGKGGGE